MHSIPVPMFLEAANVGLLPALLSETYVNLSPASAHSYEWCITSAVLLPAGLKLPPGCCSPHPDADRLRFLPEIKDFIRKQQCGWKTAPVHRCEGHLHRYCVSPARRISPEASVRDLRISFCTEAPKGEEERSPLCFSVDTSQLNQVYLRLQLLHKLGLPLLPLLISCEFTLVGRLFFVQTPPQIHVLLSKAAGLRGVVVALSCFEPQRLLQLKARDSTIILNPLCSVLFWQEKGVSFK